MAQILDSLPSGQCSGILCCYVNDTNLLQIARITNIPNWYFERTVFPGQHLLFEALPEAQLEIHSSKINSTIIADTIKCDHLRINEGAVPASKRQ